jgi:hypothetical protein
MKADLTITIEPTIALVLSEREAVILRHITSYGAKEVIQLLGRGDLGADAAKWQPVFDELRAKLSLALDTVQAARRAVRDGLSAARPTPETPTPERDA